MKYVIIGNSAAAVGAVEGIRQVDSQNTITLIAAEPQHTYARPLISYYLAGKISAAQMAYRPHEFYQKHNVAAILGQKALEIDTENKNVKLADGTLIPYDKLLVATGSRPVTPNLSGLEKENVFTFYSMADAEALQHFCQPGMQAVVLGAGLTAIKAAEALVALGLETTLVVRSRILRNFLDQGAAELVATHLQNSGLRLALGSEPAALVGGEKVESVLLRDGRSIPCDLVISAIGIAANTELAAGTGIKVQDGIVTGRDMQTNIPGIYAAGDAAQGYDMLLDCHRVIPLLPVAYAQGETAGRNMAGGRAEYLGMSMNAVSFFGLPVISAGEIQERENDEICREECGTRYRKLIFRGERLVGFVLAEEIDRAGLLTWLIREKTDVTPFKESLLTGAFNYASLPEKLRERRLSAVSL